MSKDPVVVTREELYQQVWSEPIVHVAGRLGLSGRGVAKLCARHTIPVPPRGWWAAVARKRLMTLPSDPTVLLAPIHRRQGCFGFRPCENALVSHARPSGAWSGAVSFPVIV